MISGASMHVDVITVLSLLFVIESSSTSTFFNPVSKYKSACFLACLLRASMTELEEINKPGNAIQ